MRLTLINLFTTLAIYSFSQSMDLTGTWLGNSTFLKNYYTLEYEITQTGNEVTAIALSYGKKDTVKARLEGILEGNNLELAAQELIYKTGMACMSDNKLTYTLTGNQQTLVGRWKGNAKLNTCPYISSGSITLIKQEADQYVQAETSTDEIKTISTEDDVGQALIRELSKRKYYALIIGINDYENEDIQDLDHPIADAKNLAGVLMNHYSFEKEDVSVLQNPSREEIIIALDRLTGVVTEKDHLLIFFAGHGIWNAQLNQGYWLPSDASMDSKSYWLSNSTLRDYVGGIQSKHTLLISDACFSGGILKERAVFENSRAILEVYKLPSRKAMTSGTLKTVPDKSVFIEYLVKNLINNQAPLLSADQLFRNFKTAVINNSPNGQVPQYGPISQAGDEGGDFVFLKRQ